MTDIKYHAFVNTNQSIAKYFSGSAEDRNWLRSFIASSTRSIDSIMAILDWSVKPDLVEPYDAAVALLSEFGDVLLKTNDEFVKEPYHYNDKPDLEEKWEVLIKSIGFAKNISFERRLYAITKLIPNQKRRLIKTAIIDALCSMQDEIGEGLVRMYLSYYASEVEPDEYIRQYARNTDVLL